MKFKIEKVYDCSFRIGEEEYNEITYNLRKANLKVIEHKTEYNPNCVYIYTEINSLEELIKLVEEFKCNIVYGEKDSDGIMIIEKYDTWRE